MIRDRNVSVTDPRQTVSAGSLSRRRLLQAGAVAGGGLMLSLSLPLTGRHGKALAADEFAPNAFIRIGSDGRIVLIRP
jgi:isoquinoline 1-oxidoreductase beta subunit